MNWFYFILKKIDSFLNKKNTKKYKKYKENIIKIKILKENL